MTVAGGVVPVSGTVQFLQAGTYYWLASYSGDADNNPATSVCTSEAIVVNRERADDHHPGVADHWHGGGGDRGGGGHGDVRAD